MRQRVFDAVYPCTYRELTAIFTICYCHIGISLYLQGTRYTSVCRSEQTRYIPVPTGNSFNCSTSNFMAPVYPCTYRELDRWKCHCAEVFGISLYLQGTHLHIYQWQQQLRYIPVPTGNSSFSISYRVSWAVYPCTYRELKFLKYDKVAKNGISLYLQGTRSQHMNSRYCRRYIPVPTGNSLNIDICFI